MRIATQLSYAGDFREAVDEVAILERGGLDVVWVAEAYGFDAVSLMGYLAARTRQVEIAAGILPVYTRTPTLLAMTAAGIDALSGGRCILGLGSSGPQVIEGFHGIPYRRPLTRTRETIEICRRVWARDNPLTYDGAVFTLPVPQGEGTGLGKALKLITRPLRPRIPIFLAALGERNVALAAEIADGWLPLFFLPERAHDVFGPALAAGRSRRSDELGPLEVCAGGIVYIGDDHAAARILDRHARPVAALYIGGMGAPGANFYNALLARYGWKAEAAEIQRLYLLGRKAEAAALVPDEFLRLTNLCGSAGFVRERIEAFRDAGVTMLNTNPVGPDRVSLIERLKAWATQPEASVVGAT